ncbi:MAG: gliding motility-associated C-terminal domain-containing protein [Bacteroidota bacterium]
MRSLSVHKYLYLISFVILFYHNTTSNLASAQVPFQRTIGLPGSDSPYSVLPVNDGYLIAGVTNSVGAGNYDIMLLKTDLSFNSVWCKTYGGPFVDIPRSIISTSDGGFFIVGSSDSYGGREDEVLAMKFSPDADLEWARTYGSNDIERGFCAIETPDGYLLGGNTTTGNGALAIKIDFAGNYQWSRTYGFDENSTKIFNVIQADNGNYIFDSPFESTGFGFNFMMIEITPSGDLVRAKTYNGSADDRSRDILKISGDGYYILGHSNSFGNGSFDLNLIKTDLNGTFQWSKNYGINSEDLWASQIVLTSNNELLLTCQRDDYPKSGIDIIVLNCDLSGNLQWAKSYGGTLLENQNLGNHETLHEISPDLFAQFGKTSSFGQGGEDVYIVGFDKLGDAPCHTDDYNVNVTSPVMADEDIALPVDNFTPIELTLTLSPNQVNVVDSLLCPLMPPPLALFSSTDTAFCYGGCVDFTDLSLQAPDQWEWTFVGAATNTSTLQSPTGICYPDTGCFDVQLIAHNAGGSDTLLLHDFICVHAPAEIFLGNDTALCYSDTLTLDAPPGYPSYLWSTGSTGSSIEVADSGSYWVRVDDEFGCTAYDTINVDFNSFIMLDLGLDSIICSGDSLRLFAGDGFDSYLWQDGSTADEYMVRAAGYYWVEVQDNLGCSGADTVYVEVAALPDIFIGNDTLICAWDSIVLDAGPGYNAYLWQDGSTQHDYVVRASGNYWVEVKNYAGCMGSDTAFIEVVDLPDLSIGNDTTVCDAFIITLDAGNGFDQYVWQDGSQSSTYQATLFGVYWVLADIDGCEASDTVMIIEDCPSLIWFPNSFTPNGDGLNDEFKPVYDHIYQYQLNIFNRWGEIIFETNNIGEGWDGNINGSKAPVGVYVFVVNYIDNQDGSNRTIKGSVSVLK